MKTHPHEETWIAALEPLAGYDCMSDAIVVRTAKGSRVCDFTETDDARARLAAQAPAMARLLLKYVDQECECLSCGEGVCWDDVTDTRVQPHLADCELQAVLRAAGILQAASSSGSGDT